MIRTFTKATKEALSGIAEEMKVRKTNEVFLLFTLGSQFDHLITLMLGKIGVFCLVANPAQVTVEDVNKIKPKGIILSGGPVSVYEDPPPFDKKIFDLEIPILGICLGFQLWAKHIGVEVKLSKKREFGVHELFSTGIDLFDNTKPRMQVLLSHGDRVVNDERLQILAHTKNASVAAARYRHLWGVQFHPEVTETIYGEQIFENFCSRICNAKDKYPAALVAKQKIQLLQEQVGNKKVLLALSGGSDSSTVAYLLKNFSEGSKQQVLAVYIKGIDRPDDEMHVLKYFGGQDWLKLKIIEATDRFLKALSGREEMHEKRIAIREVYKTILEEEAEKFGAYFITQGTLYTDISESGYGYESGACKARIKLHHNVNLEFSFKELIPLSDCVKDSGRNIGREIGVPEELLGRHPFPGPGLAVRIEGEVNRETLSMARLADMIFIEELREWKLYNLVWQAGVTITQSIHTCTKGDDAVSGRVLAPWAVWSVNGFTAQAAELSWPFLKHISLRFGNEIRGAGATVYRISGKPYSTIEWG